MRASVVFELPGGERAALGPGEIIGRSGAAALRLDDPSVSEAHALVSLRGATLKLLALRGRFAVGGATLSELELAPGQRILLSPETELLVAEVRLPLELLAVQGDGLPRQQLSGTCSLFLRPLPRLVPGADPAAAAVIWSRDGGWRIRLAGQAAMDLEPGLTPIGDWTLEAVAVPIESAGAQRTRLGLDAPLRVVAFYDTVHLHREGLPPVVLTGQHARLVSELVAVRGPVSWEGLAGQLWPQEEDRDALRRRWDVCLAKLRARLRDAGVRPDLVQASRTGHVELSLTDKDSAEDRT